jgi:hypothetical protein
MHTEEENMHAKFLVRKPHRRSTGKIEAQMGG